MRSRAGALFRWRIFLFVATSILACVITWQLRARADRIVIDGGAGPPVLVFVHTKIGTKSIEAWDPTTGQREMIFSGIHDDAIDIYWKGVVAVHEGKAVAWKQADEVHLVECENPRKHRVWKLPSLGETSVRLLDVTADERFAVLEFVSFASENAGARLWVVDLTTQTIVSERWWGSHLLRRATPNEFQSIRFAANDSDSALWRLDDNGAWEALSDDADFSESFSERVSRSGKRIVSVHSFIVQGADDAEPRLGAAPNLRTVGSNLLQVIELPRDAATDWNWQQERTVVGSDCDGNQYLVDADSRQVIAESLVGERYRSTFQALMIASLVLAVAWLTLTLVEKSLWFAIADASMFVGLAEWAVAMRAFRESSCPYASPLYPEVWLAHLEAALVVGVIVGVIACVGWYLAYGIHRTYARFIIGTAGVIAAVLPLDVIRWYFGYSSYGVSHELTGKFFGAGICFAMLAGAVSSLPQFFGWTVADSTPQLGRFSLRRFSLSGIFALIFGVGVFLSLGRWLLDQGWRWPNDWEAPILGEGASLAIAAPALIFFRKAWTTFAVGILLIAIVGALAYTLLAKGLPNRSIETHLAFQMEFVGSALAVIALFCGLVRRHGYRWTTDTPTVGAA